MRISIWGAAGGEVTGSAYLVESARARVLVDFGMFQGAAATEAKNTLPESLNPARLDAVLVTHAHLDHVGRLPLLAKRGFNRPLFTTAATMDLAEIILKDSAKLQLQDVLRTNRKRERSGEPPIEPLYGVEHVEPIRGLLRVIRLLESVEVAEGIHARFLEAGHLLGSASIELRVREDGREKIVLFSGDLGPTTLPILKEFAPPSQADLVFLESTYGDRDHRSYPETIAEFEGIVKRVEASRGKLLVPSFAVGRAQQILYHLAQMFRARTVRPFPVFLDSPMAGEATAVYLRHPDLFDEEMNELAHDSAREIFTEHVRRTVTAEDSKQLNDLTGPCMILAGSGMCTGGRILHHLKQNLWKPDTHVLIVGYQAHGSLGRQLVDKASHVTIHGERIAVRGSIHTLGGFSAHAGQSDLLKWFGMLAAAKPRVALVHGEEPARAALAGQIRQRYGINPHLPEIKEVMEL